MNIEFLKNFDKDLDKIIHIQGVKQLVYETITNVESAKTLKDIPHLKKLKGFKNAYRIRSGDYRIGIFIEGKTVEFARIAHRKDVYKIFP
jgi:mRNA interferase RelE/StbE